MDIEAQQMKRLLINGFKTYVKMLQVIPVPKVLEDLVT